MIFFFLSHKKFMFLKVFSKPMSFFMFLKVFSKPMLSKHLLTKKSSMLSNKRVEKC